MLDAAEARQLAEHFPGRPSEGLIVHWTLKEAMLKALGTGLRLPMRALHVDLASQGGYAELRAELPNGSLCAKARYWAEPEGFQAAAVFLKCSA
jgi:phosphopantetheinyl transferase